MIWSCEINYSGWEDDVHHHHFFIRDDAKPSEQTVVDCYNANMYNPDDYEYDERIEPLEDDEYSNWQAVEPDGYNYENVRIIIKPIEIMGEDYGERK
jgi:hypothetical protein